VSDVPTVVEMTRGGSKAELPLSSLFVEDDSLHFDYGHSLPNSESCCVIHGHSSRLSVELFGYQKDDGMILDFGIAKRIIKSVIEGFDHKYVIGSKYVRIIDGRARVSFSGPKGRIEIDVPKEHLVILEGEATSENIVNELSRRLMESLPVEVVAIKAFFFEGTNKGAAVFRKREK